MNWLHLIEAILIVAGFIGIVALMAAYDGFALLVFGLVTLCAVACTVAVLYESLGGSK